MKFHIDDIINFLHWKYIFKYLRQYHVFNVQRLLSQYTKSQSKRGMEKKLSTFRQVWFSCYSTTRTVLLQVDFLYNFNIPYNVWFMKFINISKQKKSRCTGQYSHGTIHFITLVEPAQYWNAYTMNILLLKMNTLQVIFETCLNTVQNLSEENIFRSCLLPQWQSFKYSGSFLSTPKYLVLFLVFELWDNISLISSTTVEYLLQYHTLTSILIWYVAEKHA